MLAAHHAFPPVGCGRPVKAPSLAGIGYSGAQERQRHSIQRPQPEHTSLLASTPTFVFHEEPVLTLSQEALRRLEDEPFAKQEALNRAPSAAVQQSFERASDKIEVGEVQLQELDNRKKRDAEKRIAEIKAQLRLLLGAASQAQLIGNKTAAAMIARQAARLAQELKELQKGGGGSVGDVGPVPEMSAGEGSGDPGAEPTGQVGSSESGGSTENNVLAEEGGRREATAENAPTEAPKPLIVKVGLDTAKFQAGAAEAGEGRSGQIEDMEIRFYLKAIITMAKGTLKQRMPHAKHENPMVAAAAEKEIGKAEEEIEEAIGKL